MRIATGVVMGLMVAGSAAAQQPATVMVAPGTETTLDVVAEGRVTRVPDLATVRAGVVSQASTAAAALADNARRMAQVMAALRARGIAPRDIQTAAVELQPQYRYADNQPPAITGYQAVNSVSVRFRAIDRAGPVLDALVAQGANQIDGPSLAVDQPDAALDQARTDAIARARARAQLYARAAGLSVKRIASISEEGSDAGGGSPPVVFAMARAAAPKTVVSAGERDITATVRVRFILG